MQEIRKINPKVAACPDINTVSCEISGLHIKKLNEYGNPTFIIIYFHFNEKRATLAQADGFI